MSMTCSPSIFVLSAMFAISGALLASRAAAAADNGDALGLKPGLWQVEITYQSIDGRQVLDAGNLLARALAAVDPTDLALDRADLALAQSDCENQGMSAGNGSLSLSTSSTASMQAADSKSIGSALPCKLPLVMRARAQSEARESGADAGATAQFPICLTAELVRLRTPILDAGARCRPNMVSDHGKLLQFQFRCNSGGFLMAGQGEAHRSLFGRIQTQIDFDLHTAAGKHFAVHDIMQMKFISADCGKVAPPAL